MADSVVGLKAASTEVVVRAVVATADLPRLSLQPPIILVDDGRFHLPHTVSMTLPQFKIRIATEDDVAAIASLIRSSVRGLQPEYSEVQREAALATVFTVDTCLIVDRTYFVALSVDGTLAGCGGWSFRKTLYGGDHQVEQREAGILDPLFEAAKIRAIFVGPAFARQGLGGLLLRTAEDAAVTAGFTRFEMGSTLAGVDLYASRGYRETQRLQVPLGSGLPITVVHMVKAVARD